MSLTPSTSSESNYSRKEKWDEEQLVWMLECAGAGHSEAFGVVAVRTVPLNPVTCVFMLGLTRPSWGAMRQLVGVQTHCCC